LFQVHLVKAPVKVAALVVGAAVAAVCLAVAKVAEDSLGAVVLAVARGVAVQAAEAG
jgi:hypothetical protein